MGVTGVLTGGVGSRGSRRPLLVAGLVLVVLAGLVFSGLVAWRQSHRTPLQQALDVVPAGSLRVGFTDWQAVRRTLGDTRGEAAGRSPGTETVEKLMSRAYDSDFSAASSIDESAVALQGNYGFGPATADWEAYAQSRRGATMVLKLPDGTDFGSLRDKLRRLGYGAPRGDGVWRGGIDLVSQIDPSISPELQYVVLLEDQGLVVTSDTPSYAATAARVAQGDGDSVDSTDGVPALADRLGRPANALLWSSDFACDDLAMSSADQGDQDQAEQLVRRAGGVSPLEGFAMAMDPDRRLQVVEHFEDSSQAERSLRPRARLAVGPAVGRGGSFSDDFRLTSSRAVDSDVLLTLTPREKDGFVLSSLYDGPLLLATC